VKKIAKMICSLMFAVLMCASVLVGCNWTEVNKEKYYGQTVVVADGYTFTKKDLINAFNSYGYQYLQNGSDTKAAIESTITSMVQRKLLIEDIKTKLSEAGIIQQDKELKEEQQKEVLYNTYESMRSTIKELEDGIYDEWDLYRNDKTEEVVDPLRAVKEEYELTIEYDEEKKSIIRIDNSEDFDKTVPATFDEYIKPFITDDSVYSKAWAQYIKSLQSSAKEEGRKTDEKTVLEYEQNRIYELLKENMYLSLYEDYYFLNTSVDAASVVKYYKENYLSQLNYEDNKNAYHTAMSSSSESVFYHPTYNGETQYINVDHILIKFNAYQLEELKRISNEYGWDITTENNTGEVYSESHPEWLDHLDNQDVKNIIDMTEGKYEIDGQTVTMTASEVLSYISNYYNSNTTVSSSLSEKARVFDDMKYIFNDDEGNMNSDFNYVVNYTTDTKDIMVKTFTEKSRELHDNANGEQGVLDTEYTASSYGLHLIFYMKPVTSLKSEDFVRSMTESDVNVLFANTVNPSSDKTIFHYIYDKLGLDNNLYNAHASKIIADAMGSLEKYNKYPKSYKDLYKN